MPNASPSSHAFSSFGLISDKDSVVSEMSRGARVRNTRLESFGLIRRGIGSLLGQAIGKRPIQAIYYLTYGCNSRCVYCDIWKRGGPAADAAQVMRNLEGLRDLGVRFISFTGGEPFLYPHLARVLESAKKLGLRTTVITSGLSYGKRAHEVAGLIDDLEFSLSTTNREAYLKERGVDALAETIQAIRLAVSLGEPTSILATIWEENISELPKLIAFAQSLSVMCILGPVYPYFGNKGFPNHMVPALRTLSRQPGVWMNRAFLEFMALGGNRPDRPRCDALGTTLAISPEGSLFTPCFHHSIETWPINGDLRGLYHSRRLDAARRKVGRWSFCKGCHIFCYFEGAFLRHPDRLLFLDAASRIRWLIMKSNLERTRRMRTA